MGCSSSDNVTITVFASNVVLIPNAFSPNADGQNDFFAPFAINAESMTLAIYNRWGQEVYSEKGTNTLQGWDGIYKAKAAELGVYVYYVSVTFADGEERFEKGNLTLIR